MPLKPELVEVQNFSGGLNLSSDAFHVGQTETADCQNVDFDIRGAVKKRMGYTIFNEAGSEVRDFVIPFTSISGTTRLVVAAPSAAIFQISDSGTKSAISGATSQAASTVHDGVVIKGAAYIVNNNDATAKWDGTTFTRLGTALDATGNMPKASTITVHKNRIFLGNCDAGTNPSRIRYSGSDTTPTDVQYYKSTSFIDVQQDDGDAIQKVLPFLDSLVIFKRNSTWVLRGNNPRDFELVLANPSVGCVAPRTAVAWDKGVVFLSSRGVFSFDGTKVVRLSEKIDPAINALPTGTLSKSNGVIYQQRYYLFVDGGGGFPDTAFVFDFVTGTWSRYRGWNVYHAVLWNRAGSDELHAINSKTGSRHQNMRLASGTSDAQLATPGVPTLAQFATGGFLSNGTFRYKVTAKDANGNETLAGPTADITLTGGTSTQRIEVTPPDVDGAITLNVYGRTVGSQLLIDDTPALTLYNDTGSITPAGVSPTVNSTGKIFAFFTTKWLDFGVPERRKMHRRMYAWFVASGVYDVNVDVSRNYASANVVTNTVNLNPGGMIWGVSKWGEALWGTGQDIIRARLTGLGTSPAIRVKVHDTSTNPWTFEGLAFVLQPRNLA